MGAHCTKVKRELVIQPIRAAAEDPTQPESLSADGRKRLEIDNKKSSKVRKDSDVSINAGCPPYQPSAGNYIGSTDDCLEDLPKPYAIHYITHPAHEDVSQFFGDALTKKSAYYQKGPLIGTGPSGEVYECLNLNTGELVAVKEIKLHGESQRIQPYLEAIRKENALFKTLCHPNIMRYYDIEISEVKSQNQFTVGLAVEYVSGGSIKALLDKFHSLDEKVVMSYTRQILEGLSYLHKMGIVHKNLKGSNILIDANGTIKLADFGSFKFDSFCEESQLGPSNLCASAQNSIYWLAPEVVMKKGQGKSADIWSVGCLAIEMLTGLPPWKSLEKKLDETMKLISSGSPPPFPQDISENCRDFLYKVLKFKPEDRPTVAELLAHPFVKHMSPNNSLLESDTFQSSLLYGRPTEIFRSNSSTNFKANDSRLQVLATNLTTSNVYPSRVMNLMVNGVMKNYATDLVPLSNSDIQDSEINPSMRPSLRKVQEVSYEDEYTPSITQKQFFPKSSKLASALVAVEKELTQEELEKIKAERRRQIEEEMMRELNHTSIDQTKEFHEKELENSQENIQLEDEQVDFGMDHLKVVPMQNAFFGQSPSKDSKGIDTSRSKDVENSHLENGGETSKNLEDEIERRFAEIRPNTSTNFWAWSKANEEQDKINNFSTKENIRASANNFEEFQNKEPEEQVLRPRTINRPIRPNMNKTNRSNKQQIDNAKEELVSDDMTNIVDVSDFEGGIHKRDLPVRVESAKLKGDSLSNTNSNEEREVLQSRDETEENKEESLEYAKQDLNTLVVN